jgi:PAS domain S-box-containing protein
MKILIVDDREENLYLLETLLKANDYKVVSAGNGIEALNELKKGSINLIISDILMPKMDGFQLCRECKSDDTLGKIPFVFYTATYTDKNDEEFALKLGAEKFIVKPVEPDVLINIIKGVIRDVEKSRTMPKKPVLKEKETFKLYSERLVKKLEKKMLDLERSNERVKESEEKYRTIFEHAGGGVAILEKDTTIALVNSQFEKLFGYSKEEIEGKMSWTKFIYSGDVKRVLEYHKKRGEKPDEALIEYEFRGITKNGEILNMLMDVALIPGTKRSILSLKDITRRIKAERELKYINLILYAIRFVNELIVKEKNREKLLKEICNNLTIAPIFNNIWIVTLDGSYRILEIFHSNSDKKNTYKLSQLKGSKLPGSVVDALLQQEFCFVKDLSPRYRKCLLLDAKAINKTAVAPLKYTKKLYGFLNVSISEELLQNKEVHSLLKEVVGDISFALRNIEAEEKHRQLEKELKKNFERWQKALDGTIQAIAMIAEKRDPYTAGHQRRVAQLSTAIAREMNLSEEKINVINMTAAIHDIGKIIVPVEILVKPTKLSTIEFDIIKVHPQTGYDIVKNIDFPWPIAQIILQHHERINGSGYPQGLTGKDIMLKAKIIGVADVIEAMSSSL